MMPKLAMPIRRRLRFVSALTKRRGSVLQEYTEQQWLDWYNHNPLSEDNMSEAVHEWKHDFPMHDKTVLKIEELKQTKTAEPAKN